MDDRFEATFVVRTTPEETWEVLASGRRDDADGWWLPGFDTVAQPEEVDDGKRLRARKVEQPCANTEIIVTVEASETGTTVTVVQSGFGKEFFAQALDGLSIGWSHIVADFVTYLERGIKGGRHLLPWGTLGCNVHQTPAGIVVDAVFGGFAAQHDIQPGDLLLTLGGAPVLNLVEFVTALRALHTRDDVVVTWAHNREMRTATGAL
jgi:hypothetical protein